MRLLYNLIIIIIILSPIIIFYRILKKRKTQKIFRKFSLLKVARGSGKLIWFHCSSVGEFLSIVPLLEKLENKRFKRILLTTSTLSSSKIFKKFKFKKTTHQFYPIDNPFIIKGF